MTSIYNGDYEDEDEDEDDDDDDEALVKAWEGRQEPHASRPSAHPITHTQAKYLFFKSWI